MPILRTTTSLCLVTWLLAAGCASGSSAEEVSPEVKALEASHRQVRGSVEDAYEESESLEAYTVRARYNPPRCDAPAFEILAHGRWTRAYLEGGSEVRERLEALRSDEETMVGDGRTVRVRGRWRGSREAETGIEYRVFRIEKIVR